MASWNEETKTYENITVDDLAANLVRDLFLERHGEMTIDQWNRLWERIEPEGWLYSPETAGWKAMGGTAVVHREDADKALRRLIEQENPFVFIEDEQRIVWPIQKAMA